MQLKIRRGKDLCWYRDIVYAKEWIKDRPNRVCPLCNKEFVVGDSVYMVLTNFSIFPNTVIHQSCVDTDLLITTHALMKSYDKFKKRCRGWCRE